MKINKINKKIYEACKKMYSNNESTNSPKESFNNLSTLLVYNNTPVIKSNLNRRLYSNIHFKTLNIMIII